MSFRFNEKQAADALIAKYSNFEPDFHQCPRNCVSRGALRVKFNAWFHNQPNMLIKAFVPLHLAQTLMRFKLSSTYLACYAHNKPRNERTCFACKQNFLEDELHLVFECSKYGHVRADQRFSALFNNNIMSTTDANTKMKLFFNQENQYKLSNFIFSLIYQRNRYLRFGVPNEVTVDMFDATDSD